MCDLSFQTSNLKEIYKLRGHKDEIESIACHPTKQEVNSFTYSVEIAEGRFLLASFIVITHVYAILGEYFSGLN